MSETTRYPLCWPQGVKRTEASSRRRAPFGKAPSGGFGQAVYQPKKELSVWDAILRVRGEMRALGVEEDDLLISTNIPTRLDGVPRSDRAEPADPGAAVYWEREGKKECMAIDRYTRVADNLAAIAATLEALRAIERHGGGAILDRAFAGFAQLPAAIITERPWREVFGWKFDQTPTMGMVEMRYRDLAKQLHPDKAGGDREKMLELNLARDAARRDVFPLRMIL